MRAKLSVVMPTLHAEAGLARSLPALAEGLEADLIRELVISDGGSDDATQRIAEAAGAIWLEGTPSRGGQLRRGAEAAEGDWILFLHADSVLPPGWAEVVKAHIAGCSDAAAFRLAFDARGLAPGIVAGWANLRSRLLGLPYGDQGLLISRVLYDQVGGFPDIALMEDVAMARALRGKLCQLPLTVTTSAEKYQRDGWLRRGGRNLLLLTRYLAGARPEDLAKRY